MMLKGAGLARGGGASLWGGWSWQSKMARANEPLLPEDSATPEEDEDEAISEWRRAIREEVEEVSCINLCLKALALN